MSEYRVRNWRVTTDNGITTVTGENDNEEDDCDGDDMKWQQVCLEQCYCVNTEHWTLSTEQ